MEIDGKTIKGQFLQLKFDPKSTISNVKEAISKDLDGGFPVVKMKIKTINHSNMKDEKSIAFYNLLNGTLVELSQK